MNTSQSPSADMLHSVGALMDTSFLRGAVADATEPARAWPPAPPPLWRRLTARLRAALVRTSPRP